MRVSQAEKDRTHARILEGAAGLLRARGLEATGVADVMAAAGLTNGGFYRHFESKDALIEAAFAAALAEFGDALEARFENRAAALAVADYRADYLSSEHVQSAATGCPIVALGGDIGRASDRLRGAFGAAVTRAIAALAGGMRGRPAERHDQAAREFAMLVGAVMIARASAPEVGEAVLEACRKA